MLTTCKENNQRKGVFCVPVFQAFGGRKFNFPNKDSTRKAQVKGPNKNMPFFQILMLRSRSIHWPAISYYVLGAAHATSPMRRCSSTNSDAAEEKRALL